MSDSFVLGQSPFSRIVDKISFTTFSDWVRKPFARVNSLVNFSISTFTLHDLKKGNKVLVRFHFKRSTAYLFCYFCNSRRIGQLRITVVTASNPSLFMIKSIGSLKAIFLSYVPFSIPDDLRCKIGPDIRFKYKNLVEDMSYNKGILSSFLNRLLNLFRKNGIWM